MWDEQLGGHPISALSKKLFYYSLHPASIPSMLVCHVHLLRFGWAELWI